ncbi:MAG: DMT family transporter [Alphaproteobacteria bacterium]
MSPRDVALAAFVCIVWGLGFTLTKAVMPQFPPIFIMALRFTLAAAILAPMVKMPRGYLGRIALISFVGAGLQYSLTFTGLAGVDASTAIILLQLEAPLAAVLAAVILKDMIGWWRGFGLALAFCGVLIVVGEPRLRGSYEAVALLLGGAVAFALAQVLVKALKNQVEGFTLMTWVAIFAVPQMWIGTFAFESGQWQALQKADWKAWAVVVYLAFLMTAFAYGVWYRLIGRNSINHVMPFSLLLPITTVITSVLILGETLLWTTVIGGCVTIAGVAMIVLYRKRAALPAA